MTDAIDVSQIFSNRPKVCKNDQNKGIFIKKGVKFRILAISWEISNTIYSKSLKPLHQLISWDKWMIQSIDMSKICSKGPKVCQNIQNEGIFIKMGSNLEYWQYLEKYQIPYTQNHSSHYANWYHKVNEWLRQ